MDGMDLWTSMFSGEDENDGQLDEDNLNGNNNGLNLNNEDSEGVDDDDEQEGDEDDEDAGNEENVGKSLEPDDDAIFDFELEPIVSIAESGPAAPSPQRKRQGASNSAPSSPPPQTRGQRHSLPAPGRHSNAGAGLPNRPTTSQINAIDEHGLPINYELGVVYICPACGSEYRQQDMWKRHMNQVHQYNTRRGLNFVGIDKLYHRCLECNKHIAMHSRENLLKHKFTHLPFRCTKCYICKREYKYRQDLMVHLRITHSEEIVAMMRKCDGSAGRKTRVREPRINDEEYRLGLDSKIMGRNPYASSREMEEYAGGIEVRNELMEPEDEEVAAYGAVTSLDDEEQSRSSDKKQKSSSGNGGGSGNGVVSEICEDYIHYMCPDCGTECDTYAQWNQHIEFVHDYVSRRGLNFRSKDMQMQCIECQKIVTPNTIKALRQHKISHLPHKEWLRCKLCYKGFSEHKLVVKHLLKKHNLETLVPPDELSNSSQAEEGDWALDDMEGDEDSQGQSMSWDDTPRQRGRLTIDDMYEPHIDYLCPQCGNEFNEKKHWRLHVVQVHDMNDLSKLNFEVINDRQLKCTECDKIITNAYGIQNAQQHRITHLPYKAYARCRKCHKSYTDRKGLVKHLTTFHKIGYKRRIPSPSGSNKEDRGSKEAYKQPRRQIVTVANETYEIIYLDDEEDTLIEDNDFGDQMEMPEEEENVLKGHKCGDCGLSFASRLTLKEHINEEHDQVKAKSKNGKELELQKSSSNLGSSSSSAVSADPHQTIEKSYIFLCPSCGETYKTQYEWRSHINEAHNFDKRQYLNMRQLDKYRYQCIQCKDIVSNSKLKGLQDHHFRHLPYRLYLKCLLCGTCYNHKPNIAAHLRTRHNIVESSSQKRGDSGHHHHHHNPHHHRSHQSQQQQQQQQHLEQNYSRMLKSQPPSSPPRSLSPGTTLAGGRSLKPNAANLPRRPAELNTLEDSISYHNAVDMDFITYYCPKCNRNFDSHAFWRKHIVEVHNYNSREGLNFRQIDIHHYLCLECYKRVTVTHTKGAIGQLQSHKFRHLPYRSFKCLTCNGEFVRKQMFFKHLNRETNRCDNKPPDIHTLPHSMTITHVSGATRNDGDDDDDDEGMEDERVKKVGPGLESATYQLLCPQCGDEFDHKSQWREHINIYHALGKRESLNLQKISEQIYVCLECEETLETNKVRLLQQHRFKHLPYSAYIRCQLCSGGSEDKEPKQVHSMAELQDHIKAQHPSWAQDDKRMQIVFRDEDAVSAETETEENSCQDNETSNGPYMPLPPHLYDDVDDIDFDEQYLLG